MSENKKCFFSPQNTVVKVKSFSFVLSHMVNRNNLCYNHFFPPNSCRNIVRMLSFELAGSFWLLAALGLFGLRFSFY